MTDEIRPALLAAAEAYEAGDLDRADDALVAALGTVRKQRGGQ